MARSTVTTQNIYSDFRTDFDLHPVSGDLARLTDEEAVKRSLKNVLFTDVYERPWKPTMGSGLKRYLFEPISFFTQDLIKKAIEDTISNFEPRVRTYEVYVTALPDQNAYSVTIVFAIINSQQPAKFSLLLNRIK